MLAEAGTSEVSVAALTRRLNSATERLHAALAEMGRERTTPQGAIERALSFLEVGVVVPEQVSLTTAQVHELLQRLFALFSSHAGVAPGAISTTGGARMSAAGFRKLVRAAQLTGERLTDVDVDLIFQQVVRTRGARMSPADMVVGLSTIASRLYPHLRTQSAAFHELLVDQLLPWMLQVQYKLQRHRLGGAAAPGVGGLFL